ncbi:regulator of G-protein signaling 7 [Drosophila elegans]|uniref:regulator of G-protein signaling 7 n=1 Tax=Drosophila elegans TaxID=30023 RepID=UPI0007E6AF45|nr:regulator of G-protein signaling 7 [Drosophila elegans]
MVTMNSEADKTQATNASSQAAPAKTDCSSSKSSDPLAVAISEEAQSSGNGNGTAIATIPSPLPNGSNNGGFLDTEGSTVLAKESPAAAAAPPPPPVPKEVTVTVTVTATATTASTPATTASTSTSSCAATTSISTSTTLGGKTVAATTATTSSSSSATSSSTAAAAAAGGKQSGGGGGGLLTVSGNHHHHHHSTHPQQQSSAGQQSASQPPTPPTSSALAVPSASSHHQRGGKNEDAPNILVYKKMEAIIEKMQAESTGVAVRTVKAFMSKVPSVFTGADLVAWILKNFDVEDVTEALHFAHLLSSHGYIFPIDDHALTVKNDGTFYRFQTPYFWPSNCWEPENTDYAVYLCKRTMQNKTRLELADYEAENLAKLQKMFSRKWEFIFMQAESQSKVAKKRDKLERKVLDSQERAFWDVHRPMPGCVNTTEIDIKKAYRRGGSSHGTGSAGASLAKNPVEQLTRIIALRKQKLERRTIKVSKAAEALVAYYDQYNEFDYFITSPELPNPWQTDSTEMWDTEKNSKEVPVRRVKRWAFSLRELLNDAIGREQFTKFLEKEYSGENLKFWESVQEMKALPQSEIKEAIQKIWQEFLAPDAPCPVNVDSKSVELAREAVNSPAGPNRWCFDVAASHVYHLMKSDSYSRYLRSDMYKDYLNCSRKKIKSIPNLFGVKR